MHADQVSGAGHRRGGAYPLEPNLLTVELRPELVTLKPQLKLLTLELQHPIVSRPLLRITQERIGGGKLPEPLWSIRIAGMEVGMVRLDRLAERFLESVSVITLTGAEKIVKRCHRHALERRTVEKK